MLLAQLLTYWERPDRGCIALVTEQLGQHLRCRQLRMGLGQWLEFLLDEGHSAIGEFAYCLVAAGLSQEAQRLGSEVVVCLIEEITTGVSQSEQFRRATSTTTSEIAWILRLHMPLSEQYIKMSAHCCRGERKPLPQRGSGRGAVLQNGPYDAFPRGPVMEIIYFHNTSVPLFKAHFQIRVT